ncbi:MAG: 23S rRNA (adenine(2503)-C(2))-methyltransferase RlmN [Spirochaetaceae bacterium]|nr:23S rRNA (adenine(2503)-C(2))-methyltransferase RlmN [Spirochaetaceae bacterium]
MEQSRTDARPSLLAAFLEGFGNPDDAGGGFFDTLAAQAGRIERYRAVQIGRRLCSGAASFDEMTELPKGLRENLAAAYTLRETAVANLLTAEDGTVKLQIRLPDGAFVEAVLLAGSDGRRTACVSTQAGCPAGCVFCKTGSIGFRRNLRASEMAEQFFHLRDAAASGASGLAAISNIVVMGMGEPLLNLEELRKALFFLEKTGEDGRFSLRRVTVSTSGIVEGIRALPDKLSGVRLAVSITTADEELRQRLMPVTRANPLSALKDALVYYQGREKKRVTLEAVLLGGVNTREKDAAALAAFAQGLPVIVNLIPWNPVDGLFFDGKPLREPSVAETERFAAMLRACGLKTELRRRKGRGVCGACGQLGSAGAETPESG